MSQKRGGSHNPAQSGYPGPPSGPLPPMTPNGQMNPASYNGAACTPVSFCVDFRECEMGNQLVCCLLIVFWVSQLYFK